MGYGRQRVWGTIGFGITAFLAGYLVDLWSIDDDLKSYAPAFILIFIFCIADLLCCTKLEVRIYLIFSRIFFLIRKLLTNFYFLFFIVL